MRGAVIASGLLMGAAAAWAMSRERITVIQSGTQPNPVNGAGWVSEIEQGAGEVVDSIAAGFDSVANGVAGFLPVGYLMQNENLKAFLMLIRTGEGTADAGGYSRLFGGGAFDGYADHPRISVKASGYTSTAAGAYQILSRTWDDLRNNGISLPDFSPENQDKAAIALIRRRGALADVMAGRFEKAIGKCNREWASLPDSPYGQPTLTMGRAKAILLSYGGNFEPSGVYV